MADGKQLARQIFLRTIDELDVAAAVERCVSHMHGVLHCAERQYDLQRFNDLRVAAVGKAANGMLDGLFTVLPPGIAARGIVSAPTPPAKPREGLRYFVSGHPTPNEQSLESADAALRLVRGSSENTLVIVLLSGGASALFEKPLLATMSLADVQALNRSLVTCGASITEINTIRKHCSAVKGGRLAQAAYPASVLTLAISDVPVGHESALASGPTLPDPSTHDRVAQIIAKYALQTRLPPHLMDWISSGQMPETPKPDDRAFANTDFQLILGMHELFHTAHRIAEAEDCLAFCDNSTDDWPVEKAAEELLTQLEKLVAANPGGTVALIADGELSSEVTGNGLGGRNSVFVLACAERIAGKAITVLSCGTDGIDGNSPAAGAVADGNTLERATRAGMNTREYFRRSDAYRFFAALGDDVTIGPTGNNLRDFRLLIAHQHR
jgi:hydroxypyruvate reductase